MDQGCIIRYAVHLIGHLVDKHVLIFQYFSLIVTHHKFFLNMSAHEILSLKKWLVWFLISNNKKDKKETILSNAVTWLSVYHFSF
jgi:hypothetical protein